MAEDLLTAAECADLAGMTHRDRWHKTVQRSPELQALRVYLDGRSPRWPRASVETWLAARGTPTPRT